jgi:hypothetical protein
MYNPDGTPSDLNTKISHAFGINEINTDDYTPIAKNWNTTKSILEELAPQNHGRKNEYIGSVNTLDDDKSMRSEDAVERYALKFTEHGQTPAAIAIPFTVDLGYGCRIENNTGDFKEPFGGQYSQKIVFLRR